MYIRYHRVGEQKLNDMETAGDEVAGTAMQQQQEQQQQQPVQARLVQRKKLSVLVGIDESDVSFYALQWVLDYLINHGTTSTIEPSQETGMVTVLHVQQPFQYNFYPAGPGAAAFYPTSVVADSVRKAQAENAARLLSRALKMCQDRQIEAETLILEGDPKEMICQATEQMNVNLLVVGSRGLGRIKRAFIGSVSDYCAHHSKCPILIVKPPKEMNDKKTKEGEREDKTK